MSYVEGFLALCVALTPRRLRLVREEQWRADLRDGPDLGVSQSSLLFGALCSSITARFYESIRRGSELLSHYTRGKSMKQVLGSVGVAVVLIGGAALGIQSNTSSEQAPSPLAKAPMDRPNAGYEGWWNSTPLNGNAEGLPQETVAVNTRTGKVVDAYNRATNSTSVSDVKFNVVPDPSWPANSVVIIDTATGKVIEDFVVDEKGSPFDEYGKPLQQPQSRP